MTVEETRHMLSPGATLRLTTSSNGTDNLLAAEFRGNRGDTLIVSDRRGSTIRIPMKEVLRIEARSRRNRNPALALAGIAVGGFVGYMIVKSRADAKYRNDGLNWIPALIIGLPVGAGIGGAAGYYFGREQWETIFPHRGP